jgi:agmatinase
MENNNSLFYPPVNFAGVLPPDSDFETSKAIVIPVPYDATTEWHSGTRKGPQAIIDASQYLEFYDLELEKEIYKVGIHTRPLVEPVLNNPSEMIERIYQVAQDVIKKDKLPVMLGGEHSLSLGMVKALKEKYDDLCVLQLDAHADLRDQYLGSKFSHACTMRRILEYCPIQQVGLRAMSIEEHQFIKDTDLLPFYGTGLDFSPYSIPRIVGALSGNVYISVDLDVFDPSIMPAVGTPEPGGLLWQDVLTLLRLVTTNRNIVGFDVMELCPDEGPDSCAFLAATLAYKMIGYSLLKD